MGFAMAISQIDFAVRRMSFTFGKNAASRMCDCGAIAVLGPHPLHRRIQIINASS